MTAERFGILLTLYLGAAAVLLILGIGQALYRRYQLWKFISQEEELPDPLEMLYEFRLKEVENQ